ncbi:unnamed protein product [Schistosoma margrebowiei]|uniref:Uncharacterized protein n=1 Tax=Schistosoma margrebowiei TaxID=48269 RepID=A0A183MXX5_9TREM|nr:unnamed protein product [Schistosoma margrebowiei]
MTVAIVCLTGFCFVNFFQKNLFNIAEHGLKEIPQGFDVDTIPGGMRVLPQLTKPIVRRIKNQLEQIM